MLRIRIAIGVTSALLALALAPTPSLAASGTLLSIQVVPGRASIFPGGAFAFQAIGSYSDLTTRDITKKVSFESSDPNVADFVKKNVLEAFQVGSISIIASQGTVESAPVPFEVSEIAALTINPELDGIRLGSLFRWTATATLDDGAGGLSVSNLVDWSSDDDDIVPIGNTKKSKGLSRGAELNAIPVPIHATFTEPDPDITTSRSVTVVDPMDLDSVAVSPATRILQLGDGGGFRAIGNFDGVEAEITLDVNWFSSNGQVATTTKSGAIKIRGFGTTTISVRDREVPAVESGLGGSAQLIVVGAVTALSVEPTMLALSVGDEDAFDAIASVEGSMSTFSWGGRVAWTSSDPAVASVDGDGNVLCEAPGAAVITARDPKTGITSTDTPGGDGEVTCT